MTLLHPTPSRSLFRRIPTWAIVVTAALLGVLLIGTGLVLTGHKKSGATTAASTPGPTCTPSRAAVTPPTKPVKINVYNATTRAGLARTAAGTLSTRGFTIDVVANDPKQATVENAAVVRYVAGSVAEARWVAAQVPGSTLALVTAKGRDAAKVDLVLGNAYTALAAPAAAKAAFAASAPRPAC